jgi:hypothetical protein
MNFHCRSGLTRRAVQRAAFMSAVRHAGCAAGYYERNLPTKAGEVRLKPEATGVNL